MGWGAMEEQGKWRTMVGLCNMIVDVCWSLRKCQFVKNKNIFMVGLYSIFMPFFIKSF